MMLRNKLMKWLILIIMCCSFGPLTCAKSNEKWRAQDWASDNLEVLLSTMMPLRQPATAKGKFFDWDYVAVITVIPCENTAKEVTCVLIKQALSGRNDAYILFPEKTSFRSQLSRMYLNGMRKLSGNSLKSVKFVLRHLVGKEMGSLGDLVTELGKLSIPAVPPSHFMYDGTVCEVSIYSGSQSYEFDFMLGKDATETRKKNSLVDWIFKVVDYIRGEMGNSGAIEKASSD